MSFHMIGAGAVKKFSQIIGDPKKAALHPLARELKHWFVDSKGVLGNQSQFDVMLSLITAPDIHKAASAIAAERKIPEISAQSLLVHAINAGPKSLKDDKDALYDKGLIWCKSKFRVVSPGLAKGSDFDLARRQVTPAMQPLIEEALFQLLSKRGKEPISRSILEYMATQLMDGKMEKEARLNALSIKNGTQHETYLHNSSKIVLRIAEQKGIYVPLNTIFQPQGVREEILKGPTRRARLPQFDIAAPIMPAATPKAPPTMLGKKLDHLITARTILPLEAEIYGWQQTHSEWKQKEEAASKHFGIRLRAVVGINQKINALLEREATLQQAKLG